MISSRGSTLIATAKASRTYMPDEYVFTGASMKLPKPGEVDDVVEAHGDVAAAHAEDRGVEEHVVATGQLGMEAGAEFEQRRHPLVHAHAAGVRLQDAGHALQQRRLARAVLADDTEDLTFVHVEASRR